MSLHRRLLILLVAVVLLGGVAVAAVVRAGDRAHEKDREQAGGPRVAPGPVSLAAAGGGRRLVFRNMAWGPHRDELATVPAEDPRAPRTASGVSCLRLHAAAGTGICLQSVKGGAGVQDGYRAVVLDASLRELAAHPLAGIPTRARVSPGGHLAAWTVFVGGDSYAGTDFSTRTSVLDLRTGRLEASLEDYAIRKDGRIHKAVDVNFWGVTFTPDEQGFYATLATGGTTYLVRGDLAARTVTTLRENAECPSLSPDGTRIAFKKRIPGRPAEAPWQLHVLDLATGAETPLAEQRSVDDQAVWLDDRTVAYALPGDFGADLYAVPADGSGAPARFMDAALAPALLG
ncbi:TolB family protein [Streptomyces antimicrobicus]|uniref:TolB-like translocation protein n=1 Tax=Streptomyces antimicrobicus TaxID=2883108 RepID=A0ABS8B769_9ACTN|nr:TolB-like translocation protein [Streptomyces antimicrobicus]MCB5180448.1 TolB-like translocation protein [Streptomyces antimicrobicus]